MAAAAWLQCVVGVRGGVDAQVAGCTQLCAGAWVPGGFTAPTAGSFVSNFCHPLEFELELKEHKRLPADLLPTEFPTLYFEVGCFSWNCGLLVLLVTVGAIVRGNHAPLHGKVHCYGVLVYVCGGGGRGEALVTGSAAAA